jgi:hypothetical protein
MILSLRNHQACDPQKWWARKFFSSVLPPELCNFAYKANFGPLWWDGLQASSEHIIQIINTAWNITSLPVFENFKIQSLYDAMNNGTGRAGFALLAYANWIHALHRSNRLVD